MKYLALFFITLLFISCSNNKELKHTLTPSELKAWSKKLDFPKYCEENAFEGDVLAPELKFYELDLGPRLVSATCESFAYQNVVNMYRILKEPLKPQIIDLLQIELNMHSLSYYDEQDNALVNPSFEVDFFRSPQIIHKSIQKTDKNLLEIVRFYNQDGTCGSITRYDFSQKDPKLVSFQLQVDCENGEQNQQEKWPFYKVTCQDSTDAKTCRLLKP